MNAKDAIKNALTSTQHMLGMFIADLSDADLLVRLVPRPITLPGSCHLIKSEFSFISMTGVRPLRPPLVSTISTTSNGGSRTTCGF